MLTQIDFIKLQSIGIDVLKDELVCYEQNKSGNLLFQFKLIELSKLSLVKSDRRDRNVKQLLMWMLRWNRDAALHADCVYALIFTLKDESTKRTFLTNIDVISVTRTINKLNEEIE